MPSKGFLRCCFYQMFKSESKEVVHGPIIAKKESVLNNAGKGQRTTETDSMSKRESKKDVHDRMADIELLAQKINDFEKVDVSPPSEEYLASLPRKRMKSVLTDKTKLHLDSVLGTTASELEASEKSFRAESYVQCVSPDDKMEVKLYLEKHGIHQLFEMFVNSLVLERPNQPIDFLINLVHEVGICQKKESSILGLHLKVDEMRKSRANKSGLR
ncbi:hypothetical protein RRG08_024536 [Elysia crispata]|uniref:Uncharacterized protein n=1 Tax=Elysia crispata TaxID=231223 RepID=A0AAE1CTY7_9GAST|nr:hypothetical protein RRG08_024536 [Elysia crispata]